MVANVHEHMNIAQKRGFFLDKTNSHLGETSPLSAQHIQTKEIKWVFRNGRALKDGRASLFHVAKQFVQHHPTLWVVVYLIQPLHVF